MIIFAFCEWSIKIFKGDGGQAPDLVSIFNELCKITPVPSRGQAA